jgi:hypothetical protein
MAKAMGYQAFLEDQKKKQQEAAKGQVRFREASTASRIQYTNPTYTGNSKNANYKWETQALKDVKMPKHSPSRTYNSKFDYLTKQMGLSSAQADDFRKYMDFGEDQSKTKYEKYIYDNKTDKKGNLITYDKSGNEDPAGRYLKTARSSSPEGSSLNTKASLIDNILNGMTSRAVQSVKDSNKQQAQAAKPKKDNPSFLDKTGSTIMKGLELIDRPGDAVRTGIKDKVNGGSFWQGAKEGFTGADNTSGTELNKLLGFDPTHNKKDLNLARKVTDTLIAAGPTKLAIPFLNDNIRNYVAQQAPGAGTEAALDPLNLVGGATVKAGREALSLPTQLARVLEATGSVKATDEAIRAGATEAARGVSSPLVRQAANVVRPTEQAVQQSTPAADAFNNFTTNDIPQVKTPSVLDEILNFAQSGKGQTVRGAVPKIANPARYAKENVSNQADSILSKVSQLDNNNFNQRLLDVQQEMKVASESRGIYRKPLSPDELYQAVRKDGDPKTLDDLVNMAQLEANTPEQTLKDALKSDPRIKQSLGQLDALGGKKPGALPGIPQAQPDTSSLDEMLKFLSQNENVNNSQDVSKVIDQLISPDTSKKLTMDEFNSLVRGEKPPKPEPNVTSGDKKGLLGVNLQQFNNDIPSIIKDSKPIESVSATDAIKNPVKKTVNKFYEGYVNKTHSAKVAHTSILENEIRKLTESGAKPKKLAQLKGQLKFVKKYGSDVEKAIQNESAAGMRAKTFLDGHMDNLQSALGSTKPEDMANAIRYQVAKNIKWIWEHVNPDYEIGGGWDKGQINTILNEGVGNQKLEDFTKAMKNLTQQRLDFALKYNLINKEAHAALSKNPYYIPMARDVTPGMDNVARGLKGGNTSNKRTAGAYFIQSLGDGDAEALYKDPLETLMSGTFSLFKNMAKSDSEQQLLKMAKLDSDNLFSRVVNKKEFESNGGIAVPTPKGTQYIQLQDDLMKMIKENDLPYDLNVLGKMTSAFAGAKTRSLEYHMTGVPRDLAEGYLKGQTNNPFTYLKEIVKAAKEHNLSAKEAGAYFDKAYKDGMNGINSEKMMKEYARQNKNVKPFNPKDPQSWKDLAHTVARIADMPFKPIKAIGQLSDELPRTVEIKATQKAFMKQHGKQINNIKRALEDVNSQIDGSSNVTDPFDPALQGIDKLKSQKTKLEGMLSDYDKALQRETTYRGRDIMNFSRSGRSGAAKHIRQYAIFANTATQSKDKLIRSFIERPAATIGKIALLTAPLVAAEKVMQQNLTGSDKEIYDNLPSWAKQYNYVYVNNGSVYTLPKIQELALLTDPIEALLAGNKDDLNAAARLTVKEAVPYQLGNVAQGLVPNTDGSVTVRKNMQVPSTVFSPGLDVAANDKLGFNRNAISFADKFGRKNPQANKFTLDLFKKMGGNKARADYLQYLATSYPGDAGKYGSYSLDYLLDPKNNDKLDAMLQNLNPLQDRVYSTKGTIAGHKVVKNPPKKSAVLKK